MNIAINYHTEIQNYCNNWYIV